MTASGPGAPWWEYGTVVIGGNGRFSGPVQEYGEGPDSVSGTLGIASDGTVSLLTDDGNTDRKWTMGSGKGFIVGTSTWVSGGPGTSELAVLTRKASSYSQADVAGTWAYHSLVSGGPYAPGWYRGRVTIDSAGLANFTTVDNEGTQETFTKSMIINSDGSFSGVAPAGGGCTMDSGKTVIACVITESTGNGTVEIPIFVKTALSSTLPEAYFDTVQQLYIGYYQRPADPEGLLFWARGLQSVDANGDGSFDGENFMWVLEQFAFSAESRKIYGGDINSTNIATVIDSMYMGLFNRHAESGGLAFWVNSFNTGASTPASILWEFMKGAQGTDRDTLNNKVTASNRFSHVLDPELDGVAPFYAAYPSWAGQWLSAVTYNPGTVPTDDGIRGLF